MAQTTSRVSLRFYSGVNEIFLTKFPTKNWSDFI